MIIIRLYILINKLLLFLYFYVHQLTKYMVMLSYVYVCVCVCVRFICEYVFVVGDDYHQFNMHFISVIALVSIRFIQIFILSIEGLTYGFLFFIFFIHFLKLIFFFQFELIIIRNSIFTLLILLEIIKERISFPYTHIN
jgi:hypothetical protein